MRIPTYPTRQGAEQIRGVLGIDPLSQDGIARWGRQTLAIYAGGLAMPPNLTTNTDQGERE